MCIFDPDAFECSTQQQSQKQVLWKDMPYFSIITHTTVGYGDITPVKWYARLAVCIHVLMVWAMALGFVWFGVQQGFDSVRTGIVEEISRSRR